MMCDVNHVLIHGYHSQLGAAKIKENFTNRCGAWLSFNFSKTAHGAWHGMVAPPLCTFSKSVNFPASGYHEHAHERSREMRHFHNTTRKA